MSATNRLEGNGEGARRISLGEAKDHLKKAGDRAQDIAATNRAFRTGGWVVGGIGAAIGLLGIAAVAITVATHQPQPPVFIPLAPSGALLPAMKALEATTRFTDATARQHLRAYVDNCEAYAYQTANLTKTRCLLFFTPKQQDQYVEWYSNGTEGLGRFGRDGQASIADQISYLPLGKGADGTEVWSVSFTKIEFPRRGEVRCRPWQVRVTFQWHPEYKMTDEDRNVNLGGMQIMDRISTPDPARPEGCRQ